MNKSILFMVTSVVDTFEYSVFNSNIRYEQTKNTINTIYERVPNATVVVIEGSQRKIHFDNVLMYYPTVEINNLPKTVGESTLLQNFLKSKLYELLKGMTSMCIKLSGRYYLNDKFSFDKHIDYDKINIRKICVLENPDVPIYYHNPDASATVTCLFGFSPIFTDLVYERLEIVKDKYYKNNCDIEQSIFYGVDDKYIKYIDYIGVCGMQTAGIFLEY